MFFKKKDKQARTLKEAKDSLAMAAKVFSYRRDLMPEGVVSDYNALMDRATELIIAKEYDGVEFGEVEAKLLELMQKFGGNVYPMKTITDYIETIVVAGVLALSVRSFFVTPFKIPTNSMYPSFYGMTSKVYEKSEGEPNILTKAWNFAAKAATNYTLQAPDSGNLLLEVNIAKRGDNLVLALAGKEVNSKFLGFWPTYNKEYNFSVNGKEAKISVPRDFNFEELLGKAYPNYAKSENKVQLGNKTYLNLGKIEKGQNILNFDILGGDMLFVDKFTYNFKKPQVGEPVVFLTKYCKGMTAYNGGVVDDNYYIKRLVGEAGDKLKIEDYTLYRNGKPIEGDEAFDKNAKREGLYCGYRNEGMLAEGKEVVVPDNMYYTLGDNSANSLDSRYWGFVPEKAVIGKPLIVFYPFAR